MAFVGAPNFARQLQLDGSRSAGTTFPEAGLGRVRPFVARLTLDTSLGCRELKLKNRLYLRLTCLFRADSVPACGSLHLVVLPAKISAARRDRGELADLQAKALRCQPLAERRAWTCLRI